MGVELATDKAGFHEMDEVDFSDSELVYHVKNALQSVPLVSISGLCMLHDLILLLWLNLNASTNIHTHQ